ncbi:SusC/RagA family TonB-linked outer membrane protein [Pedobacter frigoris]|nr:SusC/RagA family TonB-linked outer membrane protein [Pedobacter frigoris]
MRLTTLILFVSVMQVSASSFAQKITLSEKNTSIDKIFDKIRIQTGYDFLIPSDILKQAKPVSITVHNKELKLVLKQLLENQSLDFVVQEKMVVISKKEVSILDRLISQFLNVNISGIVSADSGMPLAGATVSVVGTNKQSLTDVNGAFSIKDVPEKSIIMVSYIGYKSQEIQLKSNQTSLNIVMALADNKLDEVLISTGMFRKADKSFTGSSTTITAKELEQFGNRNLVTSLRNFDPSFNIIESNTMGSNPNRLPDIQVRGNSSLPNVANLDDLAGLNTPLIILDGFQSTLQKMLDINQNEVESITLLKDASATAIYGSRGSNGVVVITTKLPKAGSLKLNYRADLNIEAADLSDYHLLDARQKLELEQKSGLYNASTPQFDLPLKRYYNYVLNQVNKGVNTDWLSIPVRTGVGQRHNFGLSGGDHTFRYSASAQVNNIAGVMKGSGRHTFNGTVNLAYTYKNIRFSNNLMITEGNSTESSYGSFADYVKMNPYWTPYDSKGNVLKFMGDPGNFDYQSRWATLPTNPLFNATLNVFDKTKTSELINNTTVELTLLKDLVIRAQLGLTKNTTQKDKFRPADHTAFAEYPATELFRKGDYNYGIGNGFSYDGSLNLQYSKVFKEKHIFFAGLDYNIRQYKSSAYSFLAEGFTNPNFDFISMALQYAKNQKPTGSESLTRAMGFTGNVNYNYDDRYFVDASLRMDGSSQFGRKNMTAPFWSTGIGWNLHNEVFLKNNDVVNRLKLRGSAGITGAQNFSAYQSLSTYQYYTDDRYMGWNGAYLLGLGNEDLKWQQAMKYDIGIDAEFLKSRLRVTADYYLSTTKDLVSSVNLPASRGFANYIENIGKMRNKGFEFKATGILLNQPNGWFWSITGAVVQNRNQIVKTSQALKDAQKSRQLGTGDVLSALYFEGYSTNAIWVVPSLGIDPSSGKELYLDINGKPTYTWSGNDLRAMGNSDPDFMGNFSTMFRYKRLSFNAVFGYRFGGQLYNQTLISKVENADYKYNVDSRVYDDRWQNSGDDAAFKGLMIFTPTSRTSRFVQDENTITCQNINIQYELKSSYLKRKVGLNNLLIGANTAEPFRFSTIEQERGTVYPFSRQFSLNISATF